MRSVIVIAAVLVLAACSSSGTGGSSPPVSSRPAPTGSAVAASSPATKAAAGVLKCADLVGDPDWAKKLGASEYGCEKADGDLISSGAFDCKDGSKLYQFEDGKTSYWGVSSGPLRTTTQPIDHYAPYRALFLKCSTGSTANPFSPSS